MTCEALRELFTRKALIARQAEVCEELLAGGGSAEDTCSRPPSRTSRTARGAGAVSSSARSSDSARSRDAPAFVLPSGEPVAADQLDRWLRVARLVQTSLEANGGICRSLLQVRHNLAAEPEEVHE